VKSRISSQNKSLSIHLEYIKDVLILPGHEAQSKYIHIKGDSQEKWLQTTNKKEQQIMTFITSATFKSGNDKILTF
jgi:hypothetical protein